MEFLKPAGMAPPASNYSHGVVVTANARRLIISGQIGAKPDGTIPESCEEQMHACWSNIFRVLEDAGMTKSNLAKVTVLLTDPDDVGLYRDVRDSVLDGHAAASTLIVVRGLASPALKVEIEAEAIAE